MRDSIIQSALPGRKMRLDLGISKYHIIQSVDKVDLQENSKVNSSIINLPTMEQEAFTTLQTLTPYPLPLL